MKSSAPAPHRRRGYRADGHKTRGPAASDVSAGRRRWRRVVNRGSGRHTRRRRREYGPGYSAVIAKPLFMQPPAARGRLRDAATATALRRPSAGVVLQPAQNRTGGAGDFTRRIDIFNAYAPDTVLRMGLKIAAECGNQRAEVEFAGR